MRVIAGTLGGRPFASPRGHRTHPMAERIRGALFAALGDISGLTVLDAFAGSGALGFEAASRGAAEVLQLENEPAAQRTIQANIRSLQLQSQVRLAKAGCSSWSSRNPQLLFDLVLADPPFDDLQLATLAKLAGHVQPGGLLALNWPGAQIMPAFADFELLSRKSYGDAQLGFYRCAA